MKHKLLTLSSIILGNLLMTQTTLANTNNNITTITIPTQTITITNEWDKIFTLSEKVIHRKVTFVNNFGITLVGDLYIPKELANSKEKLPAIAISGPFGSVKEQSSGLYAHEFAKRGFVTLAFDGSYTGESGGLPRDFASPTVNTEDFSAAVDFLSTLDLVDADNVGILGICGWGGMALSAAAKDTRIAAVATSVMYDLTRAFPKGYNDTITLEQRYAMRQDLNKLRTSTPQGNLTSHSSQTLIKYKDVTPDTPQFIREYSYFYTTSRGFHPRSINSNGAWLNSTALEFMNSQLLSYADEIRSPVLIVAGENAHSRYFSETAYQQVGSQDKELFIVPNAVHTDLYDNTTNKLPYDKFVQFFTDKFSIQGNK